MNSEKIKTDKIKNNISYSNFWWAGTTGLSQFFSFTERYHCKTALKLLPQTRGAVVVDVGMGSGFLLKSLKHRIDAKLIVGFDISIVNVLKVNKSFRCETKRPVALAISPFSSILPFSNETIDTVICSHVLEHVPDDHLLIEEIYRVLKPGGTAVVMVPINEETLDVPTHVRKYDYASYASLVNKFSMEMTGENDPYSHLIRVFALDGTTRGQIFKKLLIFILSLLPFQLVELIEKRLIKNKIKNSEIYSVLTKRTL
jgi:ubiquinone/menaquinone biosynthesis C-methylase UbiE